VCGSCFHTSVSVRNAVIKPIGFGNNLPIQPTPLPPLFCLWPRSLPRDWSLISSSKRVDRGAFPTYALSPGWCSNLSSDLFLQNPIKPQQWPACHQLDTVYWVYWSKILCPGSLLTDLVSTPYHPGAQEKSVTFCDFSVLEPALLPQPCHLSFSSAWQPLWCWPSLDIWYSVNLISGVVRGWSR
jgi:hypothetical protein